LSLCCNTLCVVITFNYTFTFTLNVTKPSYRNTNTSPKIGSQGVAQFEDPTWYRQELPSQQSCVTGDMSPKPTAEFISQQKPIKRPGKEGNTSSHTHKIHEGTEQQKVANHIFWNKIRSCFYCGHTDRTSLIKG
jgi:hypothetical protein